MGCDANAVKYSPHVEFRVEKQPNDHTMMFDFVQTVPLVQKIDPMIAAVRCVWVIDLRNY